MIRELGALRVVADSFPPETTARGQVEKAILDGAEAISLTIRNPRDAAAVARARATLATARDEVFDLMGPGAYTPREPR
ncbi:MAG: hypothetical protein DMF78_23085 [Acidobacteria bacterium]|nr:MAG: hypothetical protein DMF78_23085 [Acidobacteriota bacterium]